MLRRPIARFLSRSLLFIALAQTAACGTKKKEVPAAQPVTAGDTTVAKPDPGSAAATGNPGPSHGAVVAAESMPAPAYVAMDGKQVGGMVATGDRGNGGDAFKDYGKNVWVDAAKDQLSTFAADVDTASYTIARRKLTEGTLPPGAAVRVEEFVNYFRYGYAPPDGGRPFAVHMDAAPSPFNKGRHILRVGVTTKAKSISERKKAHLVFLVDVSGSMQSPDRLELAKRSLRILVDNLKDGDTVALVTYAGSTSVVLPATGLDQKGRILAALDDLTAGGSTAMASGIDLAYQEAMKGLAPDAEARVIILSDGDANVGRTSHQEILDTIAGKVKEGVTLSTIGFGMGNYKDETMEQLANKGNGNNFYIDGLSQAKRVFAEQLGSTLEVVAQDVKLQVDFSPIEVARYRLVGYENRDIADAAFRDDKVDAGEIGAGHQVTALYEVELKGGPRDKTAPIAVVRVRHKAPKATAAEESAFAFRPADMAASFAAAPADLRFAFATAAFADVLRGAEDAEHWSLAEIEKMAAAAAGDDADRKEMVALIGKARALKGGTASAGAAAKIAE
jgi:Ca-activated chloride channel homolog